MNWKNIRFCELTIEGENRKFYFSLIPFTIKYEVNNELAR